MAGLSENHFVRGPHTHCWYARSCYMWLKAQYVWILGSEHIFEVWPLGRFLQGVLPGANRYVVLSDSLSIDCSVFFVLQATSAGKLTTSGYELGMR